MDQYSVESTQKKIGHRLPLWFIGVGALAWIFTFPLSRMGDPESHNWKDLRKAVTKTEKFDFVIVGDSHAHTSLSPKKISEVLGDSGNSGLKGFNFAVDGSDVLHHADFILNGILKQETLPKILIYVPNALQFNGRRLSNRLESLSPAFIKTLFQVGAPLELQLDLLTMAMVKGYRYRPIAMKQVSTYTEIAGKKTLPIQERFMGLKVEDEPVSRKYLPEEDGFVPFEVLEFTKRFKRGADAYLVDYQGLHVSEWHLKLADLILSECKRKGIQVVIFDPPVSQWLLENLISTEKHQSWKKAMIAVAEKNQARFIDHTELWKSDDDEAHFGDPSHMSKSAGLIYSEIIAKELSPYFLGESHAF